MEFYHIYDAINKYRTFCSIIPSIMHRSEKGVNWKAVAGFMNNEVAMEYWDGLQVQEKEPLRVNLVRPQSLIKAVNDALIVDPNWDTIFRIASTNKGMQSPNPLNSQACILGEIIVQSAFNELAADSKSNIRYAPIPPGTKTEHYIFKHLSKDDDRLFAVERETKMPFTEYDVIAEINGRPTIGEVKLKTRVNHAEYSRDKVTIPNLRNTIRNEYINKRFAPLIELYGPRDFGYFVIVSAGLFNPTVLLQRRFIDKGGVLAEFRMTNLDLEAKVHQLKGNTI